MLHCWRQGLPDPPNFGSERVGLAALGVTGSFLPCCMEQHWESSCDAACVHASVVLCCVLTAGTLEVCPTYGIHRYSTLHCHSQCSVPQPHMLHVLMRCACTATIGSQARTSFIVHRPPLVMNSTTSSCIERCNMHVPMQTRTRGRQLTPDHPLTRSPCACGPPLPRNTGALQFLVTTDHCPLQHHFSSHGAGPTLHLFAEHVIL